MGARVGHRITQAAQLTSRRPPATAIALLVGALLLAGCGADLDDARARATERLDHGAREVAADLESRLGASDAALAELPAAIAGAGTEPAALWEALERVRARHGITGLVWSAGEGREIWAGRPISPRALPAPRPWHRSFRVGTVAYHAGPFLRALVVGPLALEGGTGSATVLLEEVGPDEVADRPFQRLWLEPLDLWRVALQHPDAEPDAGCEEACTRRVVVHRADGSAVVAADLRVVDLGALREQLDAEGGMVAGVLWLLGLLAAALLVGRLLRARIHNPVARWASAGMLVLLVRGALRLLDLPARFPFLAQAYSPSEFAVETPLGWLSSPGDFALTAVAYLLVVICVTYAFRSLRVPESAVGRLVTVVLALLTSSVALGLWLHVVEVAVAGGQTPFFQAHTFIPSAPPALMLFGVVAATATTYLITHIVLRRGLRALPIRGTLAGRVTLALLAMACAGAAVALLAEPHWAVYTIPLVAAFVVGRAEGRFAMALPARVLVLSVLAVAFAYPVLWTRVAERDGQALEGALDDLLGSEDAAKADVASALLDARSDIHLEAALREAAQGGRPEGIALHVWLRSASQWQRAPSLITVLDERGRTIEHFALSTLPRRMLPAAVPPAQEDSDEEIFVSRGGAGRLRCVVGRLRLRAEDGAVLGHVVITVPDRMDLQLEGLSGLVATSDVDTPLPLAAGRAPQYVELQGGVIVASSDPSLSRAPGRFGPPALTTLDTEHRELAWSHEGAQGFGRWNPDRGAVFAVRREAATLGSALLALARLVVVGVGLGLIATIGCLVFTLRSFHLQLHHKILLSYFLMSVVPLVLLGVASARETQQRHEARLTERLQTDIARVRGELELLGAGVFDAADSDQLEEWAPQRRHDVLLYRDGMLEAASRTGLVDAELLPRRLPPSAYRATVLERRQIVRREAVYAGRAVWFGYAPILDGSGRTRATVGVPLLYEADRIEEQLTLTGSVLLAAYMLTLVLVLVGGIYAARRLTRPLSTLAVGTERVARGDLDVELEGEGTDEFGQLVGAFNAMTRELREMTGRVARAERESAWRRMASQVAHEIKNPLTPMRLMLQQMEADLARDPVQGAENIRRMAPKVLKQIDSLDRIARDFAQFARLPRRRTEQVDAGALVRDATELYAGAAAQGIIVRCEVAEPLPPVWWDEEELRRVLLNMVLNATESLEAKGGGEVLLRATATQRGGKPGVRVEVRDNGIGIQPEDGARLFEPQFSTKTRGTGLGLAIVSRILEDLGGTIEFDSTPGEGTTFTLWWPSTRPAA